MQSQAYGGSWAAVPTPFSWTSLEGRTVIREIIQECNGERDHGQLNSIVALTSLRQSQ